MPEKRRKTENATNPAQHQRGEKLFLRRIGCQKKILTWRCHLRLKCLYSRTHMGNVGLLRKMVSEALLFQHSYRRK